MHGTTLWGAAVCNHRRWHLKGRKRMICVFVRSWTEYVPSVSNWTLKYVVTEFHMWAICSPTRGSNQILPRLPQFAWCLLQRTGVESQRFLGKTNYLSKFIPGYSEMTASLRQLLLQDADWTWQEHHTAAHMCTTQWCLSANASQHGLGAVCLQDNKQVAFAFRALTETALHFTQIEEELLALVYACQKLPDCI